MSAQCPQGATVQQGDRRFNTHLSPAVVARQCCFDLYNCRHSCCKAVSYSMTVTGGKLKAGTRLLEQAEASTQ